MSTSVGETKLSSVAILETLAWIVRDRVPVGFDTEGQNWMTCCGFAWSASDVLVVDTLALRGHPDAAAIWQAIGEVLEDDRVVKYCWNAAHERAFLQSCHGITLRGYEDGMFAFHERWPELAKSLKYAASVLTRIPCWTDGISWKEEDERPAAAGPLLWQYNAWDCAATYQLCTHPQLQLTGGALARYRNNLALIEPFNYASQKGVLYDQEAADRIRHQLTPQLWEAQARVDEIAGVVVPQGDALLEYVKANCCVKRLVKKGAVVGFATAAEHAKKDYREAVRRVGELSDQSNGEPWSAATRGEVGSLLDLSLNVKSTKEVVKTLNRLGLPPVFKPAKRKVAPEGEGDTDNALSQSKDAATLLTLFLRTGHPITTALLATIALRDRLKELKRGVDRDGRIRSSYVIAGPKTDRTASHKWLTGGGGNVQTIPKDPVNFRVCYVADPGHLWFKLDLTGADLWTVAARVAAEGDRTLLDDLRAGIRIPSLVGLLMEGYKPGPDRTVIREDCKAYRASLKARSEGWKDTVWKKCSHLTNYGGSAKRIRQSVIEDTYAETGVPIDPGLATCTRVQQLYLARYWGLTKWWSRTASTIMRTGALTYATGRVREFLSRRPKAGKLDDSTLREALAAEPQHITTHVIKTALLRMWSDPTNWPSGAVGIGDPIAQPLIPSVHDECNWQAAREHYPYITAAIPRWFGVALSIAGESITMPYEWGWGENWGTAKRTEPPTP